MARMRWPDFDVGREVFFFRSFGRERELHTGASLPHNFRPPFFLGLYWCTLSAGCVRRRMVLVVCVCVLVCVGERKRSFFSSFCRLPSHRCPPPFPDKQFSPFPPRVHVPRVNNHKAHKAAPHGTERKERGRALKTREGGVFLFLHRKKASLSPCLFLSTRAHHLDELAVVDLAVAWGGRWWMGEGVWGVSFFDRNRTHPTLPPLSP